MAKSLVLAEKPSVGRDLAKVLKCNQNKGAFIEGDKYIVTWALGHLVGLQNPEDYDNKYKSWNMENLPMLPKEMKLTVLKKTQKQFYEVKKLINRNDVNEIIIATDAGREGELVARWTILLGGGMKKPMKRLWISSQTDKAILDGFRNLKDGREYENLYKAAVCRAEADWIVGLNVTRALTCKHNAQLSAGRVQSPTLAMIVQRDEEIKNFKPKTFYTIEGKSKNFNLTWVNKDNNSRIFEEDFANKVVSKTSGKTGEIVKVTENKKKKYPDALYDLTELQRDANKFFNYSAKETLNIMQRLYENHKILTYPRTDSRYITRDVALTLKDRVKAVSFGDYTSFTQEILKGNIDIKRSFVNDAKVSDHHAIIPTEQRVMLSNLSFDERRVYELVVKRFLSVMLNPFEYLETTIEAKVEGERFVAKGKVVIEKGFRRLYESVKEDSDEEIKDQELPKVNEGDKLPLDKVNLKKGQTKPPARFNEGTLLSAMENPQKYISVDKESAKTLNETGGLGTVATRADIIEKLFNSFVIEKKGKDIYPTSKGMQLIKLVPTELKSPLLTAKWESDLDNIAKGKLKQEQFTKEMREYAVSLVNEVKQVESKFHHDNQTGKKCPDCGKYLLEVKNKNGRMLVCQDRECGHRENLARLTNARCPECKKKLEVRGEGEGKIYVCTGERCPFKEKAARFEKRFDGKGKVDKKEVNNAMKKMKKEAEDFNNNPFAALLGNMKFDDK